MGFFDKIFHKEKKSDMDVGMGSSSPFGGDMGSLGSSQGFPDAWNSQSGGMDSIGGSSFGTQPMASQQPFNPTGQSSPSFGQPAQPSFGTQQSFSQSSFSSPSYAQPSYPQQPSYGNDADYMHSKNLEVISSKIDALRAAIDSMNARLQNIERIAGQEEDKRKRYY